MAASGIQEGHIQSLYQPDITPRWSQRSTAHIKLQGTMWQAKGSPEHDKSELVLSNIALHHVV